MSQPLKTPSAAPLPLDDPGLIRWMAREFTDRLVPHFPDHDPRDIIEYGLLVEESMIQKARREGILFGSASFRSRHTQSAPQRPPRQEPRADRRQRIRIAWKKQLHQAVDHVNAFVRLRPWPTSRWSFVSRVVDYLTAQGHEQRPLVELILATPPVRRGALFTIRGRDGHTAAEMLALALVVDDVAVHGFNPWAWAALDTLRAGAMGLLPPLPRPADAAPWYWPEADAVRQLAQRFFSSYLGSRHPVRRCGYGPCLGSRHTCAAAPYFVADRSDQRYCCERHAKKAREARATLQG